MSLLKKPNEIAKAFKPAILVYGQPGVGKTTLALSAPNPVLIDADRGMHRVEKRFQAISLPLNDYKDLLALFSGNELDPFDSIVFDTLGKLLDRMSDYIIKENPKMGNGKGGLQMQGWGALKSEFQNLLKLGQSKGKILVFVAHEKEEKDGDIRIVRPDAAGSSGKDLVKDLDLMGYIEMRNGKRSISFNPSEKFYAKNSLRLPESIEIPDTTLHGNNFVQTFILDKTVERMKDDEVMNGEYDTLIASMLPIIGAVADAKTANEALATINMAPVIWDSTRQAKAKLAEKVKSVGLTYDKVAKTFVAAPAEKPVATQAPAEKTPAAKDDEPDERPETKFDTIINGMIHGMSACETKEALEAYIKTQSDPINQVTLQADGADRARLAEAMNARRKALTEKSSKKAVK